MPVPVCFCHTIMPGDKLWASLLPGRDPVLVTVETLDFTVYEAESIVEDDSESVQLGVRTVFGHLVHIDNYAIVRRAN